MHVVGSNHRIIIVKPKDTCIAIKSGEQRFHLKLMLEGWSHVKSAEMTWPKNEKLDFLAQTWVFPRKPRSHDQVQKILAK